MNMQDKEIDQLFHSELYDLEMEPAAKVWGNVKDTLDAGKRKKFVANWFSVAATALILIAAGLFFIPQVKVSGKKQGQIVAAKNNIGTKAIIAADVAPAIDKNVRIVHVVKPGKIKVKYASIKTPDVTPDFKVAPREEQLTAVTYRNRDVLHAVVPDAETPLSLMYDDDNDEVFKTKINVPAAKMPQVATNARVKKHRLNTLGDLINVVVSKVDKRKDKLIEFTNDDEDDATVTGINLGFVKIKKQD